MGCAFGWMCGVALWPCDKILRGWFGLSCRTLLRMYTLALVRCKAWMKFWDRAVVWMPILWQARYNLRRSIPMSMRSCMILLRNLVSTMEMVGYFGLAMAPTL